MYEYVQTATGWVLCWGGKCFTASHSGRRLLPARNAGEAAAGPEKAAEVRESLRALCA